MKNNVLSRNKIFAHKDRLEDWLQMGVGLPITAEIDPTNACNYQCVGCAGGRSATSANLSQEDMEQIIDKLSPFVKGMLFTGGGAPLLNKATTGAITYAHQQGMDVGLITTGYWLTNEKREGIVDTVLQDCQWVRFSLDAADSETYAHRKVTAPQHFDNVLANIKNLVEQRKEQASACTIGVAYLTIDESVEQLQEFVSLAKNLGVDYTQFRPYHGIGHDISKRIEQTKNMETESFKVFYSKNRYVKERYPHKQCFGDEFRVVVSATGDVYADCFTRGMDNFSYGNLLYQSFDDIWYSEKRQEIFKTKLDQPNCPVESSYDLLNALLWDVKNNQERYDLNVLEKDMKNNVHLNFV